MKDIVIITTNLGTNRKVKYNSRQLRFLLNAKGAKYTDVILSHLDKEHIHEIQKMYPEIIDFIPIIYIDGKFIGDFSYVQELEDNDMLSELIK